MSIQARLEPGAKWIRACCLSLAVLGFYSPSASSSELVVLRNRSVMRLDRHELRGEVTRLYLETGDGNFVDIPAQQIERFEEVIAPPAEIPRTPIQGDSLGDIVAAASARYGVDADLIFSLIHAESSADPHAVSRKGAVGLMQLMPHTAVSLGVENPIDAAANVDGGTRYLRELLLRYNQNIAKALAAYNAGPSRIEQFHGVPPYPETIAYITRVVQDLNRRRLTRSLPGSPLTASPTKTKNSNAAARAVQDPSGPTAIGASALESTQVAETKDF